MQEISTSDCLELFCPFEVIFTLYESCVIGAIGPSASFSLPSRSKCRSRVCFLTLAWLGLRSLLTSGARWISQRQLISSHLFQCCLIFYMVNKMHNLARDFCNKVSSESFSRIVCCLVVSLVCEVWDLSLLLCIKVGVDKVAPWLQTAFE